MENIPKNSIKIQAGVLSVEEITKIVMTPSCGAVSSFIGTTRDTFNSKQVLKLSYEAYQEMALKKIDEICEEIRSKWDVYNIAIYHRTGDVPVGEISVVIAISSVHRRESLQAVEFAIDRLKETVPIWKKEVYKTEPAEWKENKECNEIVVDTEARVDSKDDVKKIIPHDIEIDEKQIQVFKSAEEINMRIERFTARKRDEINRMNIQEFCCDSQVDEEDTCARVRAVFSRRKDSKSHLRVYKAENKRGPQTMNIPAFSDAHSGGQKTAEIITNNSGVEERLNNCEKFLGMNKPVPRDVYQRIKDIEDRMLYLESVSPEYRNFLSTNDDSDSEYKPVHKKVYSTNELDRKLLELQRTRFTQKMEL